MFRKNKKNHTISLMKLLGSVSSTGSEATLPAKNPKVKHYIMLTITLNQAEITIFDL